MSVYQQVPPSIYRTAFNCPHCGAFAQQQWYALSARANTENAPLPQVVPQVGKEPQNRPFLDVNNLYTVPTVGFYNTFVSSCFNCKKESVWISEKLVYPQCGKAPPANPDLSDDIRRDYDEASSILDLSPRGAAALIRLGIQKLCKELGKPGKDLNKDIKAMVAEGLDERIQKALDAVRVIGNNAVHPGKIDLRDDRGTAETLFDLLNLIVEKMISQPKHVDEFYAKLPEGARKAIKKRDA